MNNCKAINLIAFDVPYPADYGGVIDIYYKIKALHAIGVKVHLHAYQYGRPETAELKKYCATVHYYPRRTFRNPFIGKLPYIVRTRNTKELIENLQSNNFPIVFEGIHCTYYLGDKRLQNRVKVVRMHNIEHHYYKHLEIAETNYFKKYFFKIEAESLKRYQYILKKAAKIAAISPKDEQYFQRKFGKSFLLPPFHHNEKLSVKKGKGDFILYHGNLAVGENNEAAMHLVNHVFSKVSYPCIIAGNNPSKELRRLCERYDHISIKDRISSEGIHKLIRNAQLNVLYTHQSTGIKLKLINALYMGRTCIVNDKMVSGTGLKSCCVVANSDDHMVQSIQEMFEVEFTTESFDDRETNLKMYNNINNAELLVNELRALVAKSKDQDPLVVH